MKISTKGRYGLEALTYMASIEADLPINIKGLSEKINISTKYLEQIFFILRKNDIITTKRGPEGGYLFATDSKTLTAGAVVRALENTIVPVACLKDKAACNSKIYEVCTTRTLWQEMSTAIDHVLDDITISNLAKAYGEMEVTHENID